MSRLKAVVTAAVLLIVCGALAACGSSGGSSTQAVTNSGAESSGGEQPSTEDTAEATSTAGTTMSEAELYAGLEEAPPTKGPTPVKNKTVYYVSCGQTEPDCSLPAAAAVEAAHVLGWNAKIMNGAQTEAGAPENAIREAIAANADAIIVQADDCQSVKQPLREAKEAEIPTLDVDALNCEEEGGGGGENLYTVEMKYSSKAPLASDYFKSWGEWTAAYISQKAPEGKIITFNTLVPLSEILEEAFESRLAKECPGCELIEQIEVTPEELTPNGPGIEKVRTALTKHPEVTVLYSPFDTLLAELGGAKAVEDAGLREQVMIVGGIGNKPTMELLKAGKMDAITEAHSQEWFAWGAMDELNRFWNGEPSVPEGVGVVAVDKEHNLKQEPNGNWASPIDWRADYEKLWTGH